MQQYHPNNIEQDPSRAMWNNSSSFINEKKNNDNNNIFKKMINKNKRDKTEIRDIIFSNDDRSSSMNIDIIEKDKKIQSLNFKLKQNEIEFDRLKKELDVVDQLKNENKLLQTKLNQEYEKNKEIITLKNKLDFIEKQNKLLKDKIKNKDNSDSEETSDEDESESESESEDDNIEEIVTDQYNYDMVLKKMMKEKEIYKNNKLKEIICKHKKDVNGSKLDNIFIQMKITEKTNISKELITNIIMKLTK